MKPIYPFEPVIPPFDGDPIWWPRLGGGSAFGPFRPLFWPTIPWGDGKIIGLNHNPCIL